MAKIVRLFCDQCNPRDFYRPDRRAVLEGPPCAILQFVEQRTRTDRRQVQDRRIMDALPAGMTERRTATRGRRFRDGHAWFEGCIEEAIQSQWLVAVDESSDSNEPALVLCPQCRRKIR
ncbi:MAG: hypothetical protein HQL74_13840 [Magnetococcales bacterium]|nr:hypothetical protein [Magnetococcales bacterium]